MHMKCAKMNEKNNEETEKTETEIETETIIGTETIANRTTSITQEL